MQAPVLQSRIHPPSLTGNLISRPALAKRLSGGLKGKLILLSAPAGYGKTTLVSQWLQHQETPVVWISADPIHRDPRVFMQYLLMALGRSIDFANEPFWQITVLQSDWDPQFILGHLINEIVDRDFGFLLVVDDYHLIDSPEINILVSYLLANLPQKVTLVLTSRSDPGLPVASMRMKQDVVEIRREDLQFELSETSELMNRDSLSELSADDINVIQERTEGWISGIQLTSLTYNRNLSDISRFANEFFVDEILGKEDELLVSFLRQTSILSYLHAPLCDAILPDLPCSSEQILSDLMKRNLFIRIVDGEDGWYVLHPLFRESLAGQSTGAVRSLHRLAGQWFWDHGHYRECFEHIRHSEDSLLMAQMLIRCWDSMDQAFQHVPWLEWARNLPEKEVRKNPILMSQMAWANLQLGRLEESEARLFQLESILSENSKDKPLRLQACSARSYLAFVKKDLESTFTYAEEMECLAETEDILSKGQALSYRTLSLWYGGALEEAYHGFQVFRKMMSASETPFFALAGYLAQIQIRIDQGRASEARDLLSEALAFNNGPTDILEKFRASLHLKAAALEFELGDFQSMNRHLELSADLAKSGSLIDYHYQRHQFLALVHESDDRPHKALDELDMAEHLYLRTMNVDGISIKGQKARIWIRGMNKTILRKQCPSLFESSLPIVSYFNEPALVLRIRHALAFSRDPSSLAEVLSIADQLLDLAGSEGRRRSMIGLLVLKAALLEVLDRRQECIDTTKEILVHANETGFIQAVILDKAIVMPLFQKYRDELVSIDSYKWLVEMLMNHGRRNQILSARELDVLRLMAEGFSNKRIGEELFVAETTIKGHNQKIFQKLNVSTRTEAIAEGRNAGLID